MEQLILLIFGCTFLATSFSAQNKIQNGVIDGATITDIRGAISKGSRCIFQDYIQLVINIPTLESIPLKLSRNAVTGLNSDIHIIRGSSGVTVLEREVVNEITNFELYQDVIHRASIGAECFVVDKGAPRIKFSGVIYHFDKILIIHPSERGSEQQQYEVDVSEHSAIGNDYREAPSDTKLPYLKYEVKSKKHHVARRQADITQPFIIDVLVVVDFSIYRYWYAKSMGRTISEKVSNTKDTIRRYFAQVIHGVDLRFKLIPDADMKINIRLSSYIIADSPETYPWNEVNKETSNRKTLLNADQALYDFRHWIQSTSNLPKHDYALLYTGYDLYTEVDGNKYNYTSGLAFIGTLCKTNGDSVTVIEEKGGFKSIGVTAHEIGHGLGALHDGDNNLCSSQDRFIMAGFGLGKVPENETLNQWLYSKCSISSFRKFILEKLRQGSSCLTESLTPSGVPDVTDEIPGQMYSPNEQCQLIWGQNSYLCRGIEFGNFSSLCTAMYCRVPDSENECALETAVRGTTCGNKKWCVNGICTYSRLAPERPDNCLFGDSPGIAFNDYTCAGLVAKSSSYCYQEVVRATCCESCKMVFTRILDCEYGDRALGCTLDHCNYVNQDQNYLATCCGTCNVGVPIEQTTHLPITQIIEQTTTLPPVPFGCRDTVTINTQSCSAFISMYGSQICYQEQISQYCCETCSSYQEPITGCSYGDRKPSLCVPVLHANRTWCRQYQHDCCSTCAQLCPDGVCSDATTEPTSPKCIDDPDYRIHGKTCPGLVADSPYNCYNDIIRSHCCNSCENIWNGVKGCEYGDHTDYCQVSNCAYSESYMSTCCRTCASRRQTTVSTIRVTTRSPPPPTTLTTVVPTVTAKAVCVDDPDRIGSQTCSALIADSPYHCYNNIIRSHCCASCENIWNGVQDCEYGDHRDDCRARYCVYSETYKKSCCRTCIAGKETTIRVTTPTTTTKSTTVTARPERCIDDLGYRISGKACPGLVDDSPYNCYSNIIRSHCCASCEDIWNGVKGCEYGDHTDDCRARYCVYSESYKKSCCRTCLTGKQTTIRVTTPSTTTKNWMTSTTVTARPERCIDDPGYWISGKTCPGLIDDSPYNCYNNIIRSHCCASCEDIWNGVKDTCTDTALYLFNMYKRPCSSLTLSTPYYCYLDDIRANCCLTCQNIFIGKLGCEYGDRSNGCNKDYCVGLGPNSSYATMCCDTCGFIPTQTKKPAVTSTVVSTSSSTVAVLSSTKLPDTVTTITHKPDLQCRDQATINGQSCTEYLRQRWKNLCTYPTIEKHCCATCWAYDKCPHGDKEPEVCVAVNNVNFSWCLEFQSKCCHTCAQWAHAHDYQWPLENLGEVDECMPSSQDMPGVVFRGMTCDHLIAESTAFCYQTAMRFRCCESCRKVSMDVMGCEYGDHSKDCFTEFCFIFPRTNDYHARCCNTCNLSIMETSTVTTTVTISTESGSGDVAECKDGATIDGLQCAAFISQHGRHNCYEKFFETRCCNTCIGLKTTGMLGCEYGNRAPKECISERDANGTWCIKHDINCCYTCSLISAAGMEQFSFLSLLFIFTVHIICL